MQEPSGKRENGNLKLTVIVCTYDPANYLNLVDTLDSLTHQTRSVDEVIVVVDGNDALARKLLAEYGSHKIIKILANPVSKGLSGARNTGINTAIGDIIAFIDDDASADSRWASNLIQTYEKANALAVGGRILPTWPSKKPNFISEELYWLVGATHTGFSSHALSLVRDAYGTNMSFRKSVFDRVGCFNEGLGFARNRALPCIQAEETELSLRMRTKLGKMVHYNPDAVVYHKVAPEKLKLKVLLRRSFYQGYSKAMVRKLIVSNDCLTAEGTYLHEVVMKHIPRHIGGLFKHPGVHLRQGALLVTCVAAVGFGFIYGKVRVK
jgi:glycosyltransferase involved in cell wall biosynthesis